MEARQVDALYFSSSWEPTEGKDISTLQAGEALWNVELLYDLGVLLSHPDYREVAIPPDFAVTGWLLIHPEHRLQFVKMERRNPLFLLALIPVGVAAAKGIGVVAGAALAVVKLVEAVHDVPVKRRIREDDERQAVAGAERAEAEARRATTEAETAEFERDIALRKAEPAVKQFRQRLEGSSMRLISAEVTNEAQTE